jgi:hypothetical protein
VCCCVLLCAAALAQLYDLEDVQLRFEYELYVGANYAAAPGCPLLHTFEMDDFVAGLLFARGTEAAAAAVLADVLAGVPRAPNLFMDAPREALGVPSRIRRLFRGRPGGAAGAGGATGAGGGMDAEGVTRVLSPVSAVLSPGQRPQAALLVSGGGSGAGGVGAGGGTATGTGSGSGAVGASVGSDPMPVLELREDGCLDGRQLPREWVSLLRGAGVRKSHLLDPEVSSALLTVIAGPEVPAEPLDDAADGDDELMDYLK